MTSRKLIVIQCTGKSKGDINILVVNRRKREETGQVYKKDEKDHKCDRNKIKRGQGMG